MIVGRSKLFKKMKYYILGKFKGGKVNILDIIDTDELGAEILTQEMRLSFSEDWQIWNDNDIKKYKGLMYE